MNGLGERLAKSQDPALAEGPRTRAHDVVGVQAARAVKVTIGAEDAGQRLDNFLMRHAKGVPKSHIYRVVRGGEVRVNGRRAEVSLRIAEGDVVRIPPMRVAAPEAPLDLRREKTVTLAVVYEDDAVLAIDKPAGVAVHGGSGIAFGVIEQLRAQRPTARFLELVHRLDRETSGLLLIAKKRSALVALHAAWRDGLVAKRYLACAVGAWPEAKRQVRVPLVKMVGADGERIVRTTTADDPDGMQAYTIFRLVERFATADGPFALVDVELKTGRTHQIRVHLAHLGRPIVGDDRYGDFTLNRRFARAKTKPSLKRMFLHAAALDLEHPLTGEPLALRAPLPAACEAFLADLRAAKVTA